MCPIQTREHARPKAVSLFASRCFIPIPRIMPRPLEGASLLVAVVPGNARIHLIAAFAIGLLAGSAGAAEPIRIVETRIIAGDAAAAPNATHAVELHAYVFRGSRWTADQVA